MTSQTTPENIDIEKVKAEVEKLRAETANLRHFALRFVPVFTGFVAIFVFGFSVWQYIGQQKAQLSQQRSQQRQAQQNFADNVKLSEKEFRRIFYEKQLAVYMDISKTAAQVSSLNNKSKLKEAEQHFFEIYYGDFPLVAENTEVLTAADEFKDNIKHCGSNKECLQNSAKRLAMILRNSTVRFWQIPVNKLSQERGTYKEYN